MKRGIVLIMLLIPGWIFCQVDDRTLPGRFSIGARYSPDLCYRQLAYSKKSDWIASLRDTEELPTFGFTAGVNFRYRVADKFAFETGVLIASRGYQTKEKALDWVSDGLDFPIKSEVQFKFRYLEIPLGLNYLINSARLRYYFSAGFVLSGFLTKRTFVHVKYASGNSARMGSVQELGYEKFNLSVAVGFGLAYQLLERFSLYVEPAYRQGVTSITGDKNAREYLYSLSVSTGLLYTFKKRKL